MHAECGGRRRSLGPSGVHYHLVDARGVVAGTRGYPYLPSASSLNRLPDELGARDERSTGRHGWLCGARSTGQASCVLRHWVASFITHELTVFDVMSFQGWEAISVGARAGPCWPGVHRR